MNTYLIKFANTAEEKIKALEAEIEALKEKKSGCQNCTTLVAEITMVTNDYFELRRELADERAIVDRIWMLLGNPSYEELKGLSIYDLITTLQTQLAAAESENAVLKADSERLNRVCELFFYSSWNGVIDSGSRTSWHIVGPYRHTLAKMEGKDFRKAIDKAWETKT